MKAAMMQTRERYQLDQGFESTRLQSSQPRPRGVVELRYKRIATKKTVSKIITTAVAMTPDAIEGASTKFVWRPGGGVLIGVVARSIPDGMMPAMLRGDGLCLENGFLVNMLQEVELQLRSILQRLVRSLGRIIIFNMVAMFVLEWIYFVYLKGNPCEMPNPTKCRILSRSIQVMQWQQFQQARSLLWSYFQIKKETSNYRWAWLYL